MAIVVAGLGSAPIRRLHQSWALVPKESRDLFREIDAILDSKVNYPRERGDYGVNSFLPEYCGVHCAHGKGVNI